MFLLASYMSRIIVFVFVVVVGGGVAVVVFVLVALLLVLSIVGRWAGLLPRFFGVLCI